MKNGYSEKIKSFKEIRMENCGVSALSQICELKNISAFSLVHMGRDNGIELSVFKVNSLNDLPRVHRPAIFHQKDHFVHVRNGDVMPDGDYSGYVIGPIVMGRVISLAESKSIRGGKNFLTGKNSDGDKVGGGALGSILAVVGGVVGTLIGGPGLGAAIGGAIGGAGGSAATGDNIAMGALSGAALGYGVGSISTGIAGAGKAAGASALNSTATQGAFNAARGAALNPATASFTAAGSQGAGLAGTVGAFNAALPGAANLAGATSAFGGGTTPYSTGSSNAVSASAPGTSFTAPGATASPSIFNNIKTGTQNAVRSMQTDVSNLNTSLGNATGGIVGGNSSIGAGQIAAGAASLLSKPPQPQGSSTENYSAAKQFLGNDTYNSLKNPTENTLLSYVNTPISELQKTFTADNTRTLNVINKAYDNQKNNLVHQFAQAGQNLANSSELQGKVAEIEQNRVNDLNLAQQELADNALGKAIQVKQDALSKALAQGEYDGRLAMELAKVTGQDQALQYAIERGNYEDFQKIMASILAEGLKPR